MSFLSFNELVCLDDPQKFLDEIVSTFSENFSLPELDARKRVASLYKMPSWYKLQCQLEASYYRRLVVDDLYDSLNVIRGYIDKVGFPPEQLPTNLKRLLKASKQSLGQEKLTLLNLLNSICYFDKSEWENLHDDYLLRFVLKLKSLNIRMNSRLADQVFSFVEYKQLPGTRFEVGDLMDHKTSTHCYVRYTKDADAMYIDEIYKVRGYVDFSSTSFMEMSASTLAANIENFLTQNIEFIEGFIFEVTLKVKSYGINFVHVAFDCFDAERFYHEVVLNSRLGEIKHEHFFDNFSVPKGGLLKLVFVL
ncbi:hypothetical protein [Algicola sagamiensis]|uniref:hypothetical protein n=1 Tax=Algicola sagamiensis TaxID=163869 RepID=UPI00038260DA|nr:hypothetical protein [Algicola sagamiensis]